MNIYLCQLVGEFQFFFQREQQKIELLNLQLFGNKITILTEQYNNCKIIAVNNLKYDIACLILL